MGEIIQETLRYRSDIRPMSGVDTLTQASALSDSDQLEMPFGFYRGKRPPGEEKGGTTMTPSTSKNVTRMDKKKPAMTTAAKKNNKKKKPHEESCGVMELEQTMLILTRKYKLILCMVRDVHTITT